MLGERRELNPRMVDSQSTALIHLATSAPPLSISLYCFTLLPAEIQILYIKKKKNALILGKNLIFSFEE